MKRSFTELCQFHKTDKRRTDHNYVKFYEKFLYDLQPQSLLEIGLGPGASAKVWLDFFPETLVYIMELFEDENSEKWNQFNGNIPGIILSKGSSTEIQSWNTIPENLDLIIDDGSHFPNDQITTFYNGFSKLKPGGYWIIEDCHCSFEEKYGFDGSQSIIFTWLYNLINQQQYGAGFFGGNFDIYSKGLNWPANSIESYRTYKSLIVIEKKS